MQVFSSAFKNHETLPVRCTGYGDDMSPELQLCELPVRTKSIAIILDDLDVPFRGELTHWVIWNISPITVIPEGLPAGGVISTPVQAMQGKAWGAHRYRGPKPPRFMRKAHTYRFSVYALDQTLDLPVDSGKAELTKCMQGHVLETAELFGTFSSRDYV